MTDQSSQDNQKYRRPKSLSEVLGRVLEPVIARRTGMQLDLLAAWREIVGDEFAQTTRPEKINWPRRAHEEDPFEPATLVVACEPAAALFFQHEMSPVLERVNQFFGFEAVRRIQIVQKPVVQISSVAEVKLPSLDAGDEKRIQNILGEIEDPGLREVLVKLGRGIYTRNKEQE